jgi:hypothetical protein
LKLGYARVSAKDQNPERQLKKFRDLGIEERYIFIDKQSGKGVVAPFPLCQQPHWQPFIFWYIF